MYNTHAYTDVRISHLPLSSNNSWYRYRYSVSEQAKSIGIGSIGKLWYRSHPIDWVISHTLVGFGRIPLLASTLRNTETLQKKFNDVLGRLNADIVDTIIEQNLSDWYTCKIDLFCVVIERLLLRVYKRCCYTQTMCWLYMKVIST